jgi:methyl-accepting chemotaxis protein
MNTWKNLKVSSKLFLSFGICLFLSLIAGVAAIVKMAEMNSVTINMANGPLRGIQVINDVRNQMKQYRLAQMRFAINTDPAAKTTALNIANDASAKVQSGLDDYAKICVAPEDKDNLKQLANYWSSYRELDQNLLDAGRTNDMRRTSKILNGASYQTFSDVIGEVNKIVDWNKDRGDALKIASQNAYSNARLVVVLLLVVAFALGIVLSIAVTKLITSTIIQIDERLASLNNVCISNLAGAIEELSRGNLESKIVATTKPLEIDSKDEFADLAGSINGIIEKIESTIASFEKAQKALKEMIEKAHNTVISGVQSLDRNALEPLCEGIMAISKGDLTKRIDTQVQKMPVEGDAEFVKLALAVNEVADRVELALEAYNETQSSLARLIDQTQVASNTIAGSASELASNSQDLSDRTTEQASSLEETASNMEEMTATVRKNAENAKHANEVAIRAREVANAGGDVVQNAVKAMEEINSSSKSIADIVSVIDELAFQTNLLALNAAVEAARVGEQGRGFAVVATEVRNLAERSSGAAKEIKALVQNSSEKVRDGSILVNKSGDHLHEIVESVGMVAEIVAEISAASQEQASGIQQVNQAVEQMDQITQQNAALVEEAAASSQAMSGQSLELQRLIDQFKTSASSDERNRISKVATQKRNAPKGDRQIAVGESRSSSRLRSSRTNLEMETFDAPSVVEF